MATDRPDPPRLALSAEEAADALGMARPTFREKLRNGEFAYVQFGSGKRNRRYLIPIRDLEAWLDRNRTPPDWETETDESLP